MSIVRLDTGSDATWNRAWVITTTAEVTAFMATYTSPLGPKRGDMIYNLETSQVYIVTNGNGLEQLTGKATLPIDLANDVTGVLPVPNGGTGISTLTAGLIPYGDGTSPFQSSANLSFNGSALALNGLLNLSGSSAGQIQFPATQNPSSNVNTLDDFERGTWTPVIDATGGVASQTYTVQQGRYIKLSRLVFVGGYAQLSSKGTMTGNVRITGLPFVCENSVSLFYSMQCQWFLLATAHVYLTLENVFNTSYLDLYGGTAAANSNTVRPESIIGNGTGFVFGGCYTTDT